jgi:hypothetical protein
VDFELMIRRQAMYTEHEKRAYETYLAAHRCRLDAAVVANDRGRS